MGLLYYKYSDKYYTLDYIEPFINQVYTIYEDHQVNICLTIIHIQVFNIIINTHS